MNILLMIILIGVSLSMDAFSLALIYGTYSLRKRDIFILSGIVGIFHFFMPLIGLKFGSFLVDYFILNVNLVVGFIFFIIGIEMVLSSIKDDDINVVISWLGFILFGFSVSIDSFTTGIGLSLINNNYFLCSFIFMIISFSFTYLGLILGTKLNDKFGKLSTVFGGFVMVILALYYLVI